MKKSKTQYRTVDISTLAGLKTAERLKANGWFTYRVGMFILWFYRPAKDKK